MISSTLSSSKGIHGCAGHIARFKDNRWTKRVTEWTPREWTRRQGRPKTRWRDNLFRHLGPAWPRIAVCGDSSAVQGGVPPYGVKETLVVMPLVLNKSP